MLATLPGFLSCGCAGTVQSGHSWLRINICSNFAICSLMRAWISSVTIEIGLTDKGIIRLRHGRSLILDASTTARGARNCTSLFNYSRHWSSIFCLIHNLVQLISFSSSRKNGIQSKRRWQSAQWSSNAQHQQFMGSKTRTGSQYWPNAWRCGILIMWAIARGGWQSTSPERRELRSNMMRNMSMTCMDQWWIKISLHCRSKATLMLTLNDPTTLSCGSRAIP